MATGGAQWRERDLDARRRAALDGESTHIRVGSSWIRGDHATAGEEVVLVGHARELHGTVCTCCARRAS